MPTFAGRSTGPDRRQQKVPPTPKSSYKEYSLFPHPAASMFAHRSDNVMEDSSSSNSNNGETVEGHRLTTMTEETGEEEQDVNRAAAASASAIDFSGLTRVIQADAEEATEAPQRSTFRSKKEGSDRIPIRHSSNMRLELKTINSGRSLTSIDSVNYSKGGPLSPGGAPLQNIASPRATDHAGNTPSTNLGSNSKKSPSIASGLRRLFPRQQSPSHASSLPKKSPIASAALKPSPMAFNSPPHLTSTVVRARRYQLGETVLVNNHQSHWAVLVNQYGFPPGEGERPEEQRGPYQYVLATVEQIHYDEYEVYYTVRRADNGAQQRGDAQYMHPILSEEGEMAAQRAATRSVLDHDGDMEEDHEVDIDQGNRHQASSMFRVCGTVGMVLLYPLFLLASGISQAIRPVTTAILQFVRKRAVLILNGEEPYACQIRWTAVNFVVLCATWYMFVDQARLAFFPPEADDSCAIINLVIWVILVLELLFETFIRPDGYQYLILSDKAFAPDVVRYINVFHLFVESFSLVVFIPEFYCLFASDNCSTRYRFSFHQAALLVATGSTRKQVFWGRAFFAAIRLRVFGLVRHWKTMWINNTALQTSSNRQRRILQNLFPAHKKADQSPLGLADDTLTNASTIGTALMVTNSYRSLATLWVVLGLFPILFTSLKRHSNRSPQKMTEQLEALYKLVWVFGSEDEEQSNNICTYWENSLNSWAAAMAAPDLTKDLYDPYLLLLEVTPSRCQSGESSELICLQNVNNTSCQGSANEILDNITTTWKLRSGSIVEYEAKEDAIVVTSYFDQTSAIQTAAQSSCMLQLCMVVIAIGGLSVMRRDAEVLVLGPLRRMLKIVARYAKNPLSQPKMRRRYSPGITRRKVSQRSAERVENFDDDTISDSASEYSDDEHGDLALGSYETEQLITAVTVITDLLRKCWGVAGADIISTNLASTGGALTEVFNPTVPGKSVYALFGFAAINGFDHAMRSLGDDLIDLINNVAKVLHEEIFRWGFGNSGQCNKNLGSAFLMVFRIGLVKEVIQKLEHAQDVIFSGTKAAQEAVRRRVRHTVHGSGSDNGFLSPSSTSFQRSSSGNLSTTSGTTSRNSSVSFKTSSALRYDQARQKAQRNARNKAMSLNLASLPGISTFTDRAVIGMLKSFACMYRDKDIRKWNKDFRLGAGVGAFEVSIFYGMDAGWAVEGAVGSQYKIDATYLSPHVNMASRMMSACKQYGVSILLSQAVQELMSETGRTKLRHLDTVTVKGSSVKQKIFTYDARNKGVDFFLFGRSDEQADMDAERFSSNIWNSDQDLKAMRQHITDDFMFEFTNGHKAYINGDWPTAIKRLERANEIMIEAAVEQGYLEDEFDAIQMQEGEDAHAAAEELKRENGDGPSLYLINLMKSHGGVAPRKWEGWHPLTRK